MTESIKFSFDLPVSPERVYRAWLNSHEHSQFTGSPARIEPKEGGTYTAFNGDVRGENLVLTPFSHIVQTWRTTEFADSEPDSQIDIKLEPTCLGTLMTLSQTGVPRNQSAEFLEAWENNYFRPLLRYFEEMVGETTADMGDG